MTVSQKTLSRKYKTAIDFYRNLNHQPRQTDLRIFTDEHGLVVKLLVTGERDFRFCNQAMKLDHPFFAKFLADYAADGSVLLETTGLTCHYFNRAETPDPAPAPRTPAQDAADSLTAELTAGLADKDAQAVAKRIASGLALVEAGTPSQYNTTWQNLTALGNWTCDCPDATHRALTSKRGTVCKHTAAGMIAQRIQQAQAVTTQREVAHRNERRARFATDPAPGDGGRLASDYETMKPTPAYQQMLDRQRARIEATQAGYDAALKADPLNLAAPKNVNIQPRYGR